MADVKKNKKTYEYYPSVVQMRQFRILENKDGTYHIQNNRFGFHRNVKGTFDDLKEVMKEFSEYDVSFRFWEQ